MYAPKKHTRRFTLLLLEEGEFYVKDYVADCSWPSSSVSGNWQRLPTLSGQLRLCTKSLFFEADDIRVPIVRLPFVDIAGLEGHKSPGATIVVTAQRLVKMKANATDAPYVFERGGPSSTWSFKLPYASLEDVIPLAQQMMVASRLPHPDKEVLLSNFLKELEEGHKFDPGHLRNPATEAILLDLPVLGLAPLVKESGRLAVTADRVYFQPLHNIGGDAPVLSHPLVAVAAVARKRSALSDVGLEVYFAQGDILEKAAATLPSSLQGPYWGNDSAFFAFQCQKDRDTAVKVIMSQTKLSAALSGGKDAAGAAASFLEAEGHWLKRVTAAWQRGKISNFDYLLYCNLAAGRSFKDLTQYPVFPWVLKDYSSTTLDLNNPAVFRDLSKPIGALDPKRLESLVQRYHSMPTEEEGSPEPPFMYGTHYSCSGYCLFWLVRAAPGHMLRLQSGRFDAPDRLFCSVKDSWESVLSNPADVKELIPEFFIIPTITSTNQEEEDCGSSFLINKYGLPLGTRQNGRPVGDVELPPWAHGEPTTFLALNRAALESPFVSANLHHWIDLIFGYKQKGRAAIKANNVFRSITYEGAVDLEAVEDADERLGLETQINEFGQCPRQLFSHPHPGRLVCPPAPGAQDVLAAALFPGGGGGGSGGDGDANLGRPNTSTPSAYSPIKRSSMFSGGSSSINGEIGRHALAVGLVSAMMASTEEIKGGPLPEHESSLLRELDVVKDGDEDEEEEEEIDGGNNDDQSVVLASESTSAGIGAAVGSGDAVVEGPTKQGGLFEKLGSTITSTVATSQAAGSASLRALFYRGVGDNMAPRDSTNSTLDYSSQIDNNANNEGSNGNNTNISSAASRAGNRMMGFASSLATQIGARATSFTSQTSASSISSAPSKSPLPQQQNKEQEEEEKTVLVEKTESLKLVEQQQQPSKIKPRTWWGSNMRSSLQPQQPCKAGTQAINALKLDSTLTAYSASHDGHLRIHNLQTFEQIRAAQFGNRQPLASLALLHTPTCPSYHDTTTNNNNNKGYPLVLTGSYDSRVYAYCVETARALGEFTAHRDTVSCLEVFPSPSTYLCSASWDGCVAMWSLEEGRHPWSYAGEGFVAPVAAFSGLSGGVWSLTIHPSSLSSSSSSHRNNVLLGLENGQVACWDPRLPSASSSSSITRTATGLAWEVEVSPEGDYVGGVTWTPDGECAVAATGDGHLTLIDPRKTGTALSQVQCGGPLRCCDTDGDMAVAGREDGSIVFWSVAQQRGRQRGGGGGMVASGRDTPDLDGLYAPLSTGFNSPIDALAAVVSGYDDDSSSNNDDKGEVWLVTGHEHGHIAPFKYIM
jgi:WD40 repeat protein